MKTLWLSAFAAICALLIAGTVMLLFPASFHDVTGGYSPCVTEDSPGPCYWDAKTMGNGQGRSFTIDTNQHITYWDEEKDS